METAVEEVGFWMHDGPARHVRHGGQHHARGAGGGQGGQAGGDGLPQRLVHRACQADDEPVLSEDAAGVGLHVLKGEGLQALHGAADEVSVRVALIKERIEGNLAQLLVVLVAQLVSHGVEGVGAQTLELGGLVAGLKQGVGEDLQEARAGSPCGRGRRRW